MVTFNNAGRMGNWLFEAATAIAYALRHGLEFTVPATSKDPRWNPVYCLHLVNKNFNPHIEKISLWENGHQYQKLPFNEEWRNKNIVVEGYRQSEKYFMDYRNELLYLFGFPYEKKEGVVSVHVRRGDYVFLQMKHPPVTKEWYESAMSKFEGLRFKFFSDDIKWCRDNFGGRPDCDFSTNSNEVEDMVEGSCCEHNIASASTFGWWQAWLNRNPEKKIIIPELWFQPGWDGLETKDIVPDYFTKL
jgi:hypothetical protein